MLTPAPAVAVPGKAGCFPPVKLQLSTTAQSTDISWGLLSSRSEIPLVLSTEVLVSGPYHHFMSLQWQLEASFPGDERSWVEEKQN